MNSKNWKDRVIFYLKRHKWKILNKEMLFRMIEGDENIPDEILYPRHDAGEIARIVTENPENYVRLKLIKKKLIK